MNALLQRVAARLPTWAVAPSPGKRWVELVWLGTTVVWGLACAVVMLGGFADSWTDHQLLPFGVILGLGVWALPTLWPSPDERSLPLAQRSGFRLGASVAAFALGMNYLCTPYFFDVLHMRYGFNVTLKIENNPVFLYFLTIAYFSTYAVMSNVAWRAAQRLTGRAGVVRWLAAFPMALVIALLETLLNANPFIRRVFCYEDIPLVLTFGTFSYGVALWAAMPVWGSVAELSVPAGGKPTPLWRELAWAAAGLAAITITFALLRHGVAPHLTVVESAGGAVDGVSGMDLATSCLRRP